MSTSFQPPNLISPPQMRPPNFQPSTGLLPPSGFPGMMPQGFPQMPLGQMNQLPMGMFPFMPMIPRRNQVKES